MTSTLSSYFYFREWQHIRTTGIQAAHSFRSWLLAQRFYVLIRFYFLLAKDIVGTNISVGDISLPTNEKAIQVSWLVSHGVTLFSTISLIYGFLVKGIWDSRKYDACVISCILTYTIVIYRHFLVILEDDSQTKDSTIPLAPLLKSENTYLLATSIITFNSSASIVKILPFSLYSFLNVYITLLDDFFQGTLFSKILLPYTGLLEDRILTVSAVIECYLVFVHANSWIFSSDKAVLSYLFISFLRLDSSPHLRSMVQSLISTALNLVSSFLDNENAVRLQSLTTGIRFLTSPALKEERPPRKTRVASLNFEQVQIVHDI